MPDEGGGKRPQVNLEALGKIFGGSLIWVAFAVLVIVITIIMSISVGRVEGTQVGILLSKVSGKIEVIPESGVRLYNAIFSEFYVLDRTMQTLIMEGAARPDHGDSLKIKTVDGSDVHIDLKVQYKIIPTEAEKVILTSGPEDAFTKKWARDYVRSIVRNHLGELKTEELYVLSRRRDKVRDAENEIAESLRSWGIDLDSVTIPSPPVFNAKYMQKITEKKLADQMVQKEVSKANAATEDQKKQKVEAENERNVAVREFSGAMEQKKVEAKAEANRVKLDADAYVTKTKIAAEAAFLSMQQEAVAILAKKKADAEGIEELKKALEGEGGRNMVKLEYAKRLKDVTIYGQPFTYDAETARFQHMSGAASQGRARK